MSYEEPSIQFICVVVSLGCLWSLCSLAQASSSPEGRLGDHFTNKLRKIPH